MGKSKEAKANAATNASKGNRKKLSNRKIKEKVNNMCLFKEEIYNKILTEVRAHDARYKIITTSIMVDRLNINGSLARAVIKELIFNKLIRPIVKHHRQCIYTFTNIS